MKAVTPLRILGALLLATLVLKLVDIEAFRQSFALSPVPLFAEHPRLLTSLALAQEALVAGLLLLVGRGRAAAVAGGMLCGTYLLVRMTGLVARCTCLGPLSSNNGLLQLTLAVMTALVVAALAQRRVELSSRRRALAGCAVVMTLAGLAVASYGSMATQATPGDEVAFTVTDFSVSDKGEREVYYVGIQNESRLDLKNLALLSSCPDCLTLSGYGKPRDLATNGRVSVKAELDRTTSKRRSPAIVASYRVGQELKVVWFDLVPPPVPARR